METWRPIAFAEGYEVSDQGGVRSRRKRGGPAGSIGLVSAPRVLKLKTDRYGYLIAALSIDRKVRHVGVHRLVALAFVGDPPADKKEVRHLDGCPTNNIPGNLAWGDQADNAADKIRHGRSTRGTVCTHAKLTVASVIDVFKWRKSGLTYRAIAERLNVSESAIGRVCRGEGWLHVEQEG